MKMKNLYLSSLTSTAILASGFAYAETLVTVPTFEGGLTASVGTFYVVPSSEEISSLIDDDNGNFSTAEINPDYQFGIDASLGYVFEDTANSIELFFRNINTSDSISGQAIPRHLMKSTMIPSGLRIK